jgi:RIO kinase 1
MTPLNPENWDDDSIARTGAQLRSLKNKRKSARRSAPKSEHALLDEIVLHGTVPDLGVGSVFSPTYTGSRIEREWILNYLGPFYDQDYITDVLFRVKGGKEANVYCCAGHPDTGLEWVAAKIYRPRMLRNLRNDARYRQSRVILDDSGKEVKDHGYLHAIAKGTEVGKNLLHTSWLEHEYTTLQTLYAAGVHVPRPLACGYNTILMAYIGEDGLAAPNLTQVNLGRREARTLFDRLLVDLEKMLVCFRVHGDFSAYNVLYWDGEVYIIDLPQAVDPRRNTDAYDIFKRDVLRLCQYFGRYHIPSQPETLAREMWQRYAYPEGPSAEDLEEAASEAEEEEE